MGKFKASSTDICDYIFDDYIRNMQNDDTNKVIEKMPLLVNNGKAVCLSGKEDLFSVRNMVYRVASKFIQKYNKSLSDNRRRLREYEFGGSENVYIKNDSRLVDLVKYSLDFGVYYAQLSDYDYCALKVSGEPDDEYYINYEFYIIGDNWKKWKKKFDKMLMKYQDIKKNEKTEIILYTDGRPSTTTIFKPFDKVIIKNKQDILNYIDNFVNNIPKYYEYGMTPKLSIMLYGNPGTGKSTFAKALANYLDMNTITSISPDYFTEKPEVGSRVGRRSTASNTICVIDDIDCVCKSREIDSDSDNARVLSNLLAFLDNPPTFDFKAKNGIQYPISIVVASTNYYDKLDDAVKRYGRFDLKIEMEDFDKKEAEEMCEIYNLKLEELVPDCNKKNFKISPSQLQAICLENIDKSMKEI